MGWLTCPSSWLSSILLQIHPKTNAFEIEELSTNKATSSSPIKFWKFIEVNSYTCLSICFIAPCFLSNKVLLILQSILNVFICCGLWLTSVLYTNTWHYGTTSTMVYILQSSKMVLDGEQWLKISNARTLIMIYIHCKFLKVI